MTKRGFVLPITLLIVALLLGIGTTFLSFSLTEHTIARNNINLAKAFWLAEAGLAQGYKQMGVGKADLTWTGNLGGGEYSYVTGLDLPEEGQLQIAGIGKYKNTRGHVLAVYDNWSLGAGALNLVSGPGGVNATFNGDSLTISDITVTDDAALETVTDAVSPGQNIGPITTGAPDLNLVLDLASHIRSAATVHLSGNVNTDIGSASNPVIAWADGDVSLAGPATGYGVLLVEGAANIRGSLSWYGLVLVVGTGDFASPGLSGVADIHGQVIVASETGTTDVTVAGNTLITLDPQDFVEGLIGLRLLSWRQLQ